MSIKYVFNPTTGNLDATDKVAFNGEVTLGTAAAPSIFFTGDPNTGIYSPGADQLALSTNGTGRLFVDASGNVGVGRTPSYPLDVNTGTGVRARFGDGTNNVEIYGADGRVSTGVDLKLQAFNNNIIFGAGGSASERMRITSAGLVGIGTSAPAGNLDVTFSNSTVYSSSNMFAGGISQYIYNSSTTDGVASTLGLAAKGSGTTAQAAISAIYSSTGVGHLAFGTRAGGNVIERMRVTSTGVGIGTTSPASNLEVRANSPVFEIGQNNTTNGGTITWNNSAANFEFNTVGTSSWPIVFKQGSTERARIDSSGRLLIGTSSSRGGFFNLTTEDSQIQLEGTSAKGATASVVRNSTNAGACYLILGKTRGASVGSTTLVQSGDDLGNVSFQGADGSELVEAARITCAVDGTPGANDMPGRLVFSTTADGASSPTERMRISSAGVITLNTVKHISASRSWDMAGATDLFDVSFGSQGNFAAEFTWILQDSAAADYGTRIGKLYVAAYGSGVTGPVNASVVSEDKVAGNSGTLPSITWSASVAGGKVRLSGTPSSDSGDAIIYLWGSSPLLSEITAL